MRLHGLSWLALIVTVGLCSLALAEQKDIFENLLETFEENENATGTVDASETVEFTEITDEVTRTDAPDGTTVESVRTTGVSVGTTWEPTGTTEVGECDAGEYFDIDETCYKCRGYMAECSRSRQCCGLKNMMCFARNNHHHGEIGRCDCDKGFFWDKRAAQCLPVNEALYVTYFIFATVSMVAGVAMLCLACKLCCSKKNARRSVAPATRYEGYGLGRRVVNPRVAVVVVPCTAKQQQQRRDAPPKYDDLATSSKSLEANIAPPTYNTSHQMSSSSEVPNAIGLDHYGFYKSVQGWLKDEPASDVTGEQRDVTPVHPPTTQELSMWTDNPGFSHVDEQQA